MTIDGNKITADEGKIIVHKTIAEINGTVFYLSIHDSPENYKEIDPPLQQDVNDGEYMLNKFGIN
jgi:hypothetical protein